MQLCASTLTACSRFCLARAYSSLHKHATPCTHTVAFSSWSLNCHAALCTHAGHLQQVALCTSMHASLCTRLLPAAGSALHRHSSSMLMLVACSGSLFALACCSLHSHATLCMHTSCLQQVAPCTSCSSMHAPAGEEPVGPQDGPTCSVSPPPHTPHPMTGWGAVRGVSGAAAQPLPLPCRPCSDASLGVPAAGGRSMEQRWQPLAMRPPPAGRDRRALQTAIPKFGVWCRRKRTGSAGGWSSLHPRWGAGCAGGTWGGSCSVEMMLSLQQTPPGPEFLQPCSTGSVGLLP